MFKIAYHCERSIVINKSLEDVHRVVSDFSTWKSWSPWLCQEKDAKITRIGDANTAGHAQSWEGKRVGVGTMTLLDSSNCKINYRIDFIKPWKSTSLVSFVFEEVDDGTKVLWTMDATLPIFMFFMKKMMVAWINSDFDRGLLMLKEHIETGNVDADSELTGKVHKSGFNYIGIKKSTTISQMPDVMGEDFEYLNTLITDSKVDKPDIIVSFYHKFDLVKGTCEFTSALGYKGEAKPFEGLVNGRVEDHSCAQVIHSGPYRHIGNSWSTVMSYQRSEKLKANKKVPWYEEYLNSPMEVNESQLKTEINIPVK